MNYELWCGGAAMRGFARWRGLTGGLAVGFAAWGFWCGQGCPRYGWRIGVGWWWWSGVGGLGVVAARGATIPRRTGVVCRFGDGAWRLGLWQTGMSILRV